MFWYLITIILITAFYIIIVKPLNYWKNRGVVQYHFLITLREILLGLIPYRTVPEIVEKFYKDFPGARYCGVYRLLTEALVIRDPELIKQITVKDFEHFMDHMKVLPDISEPIWEKNLFALEADKWREMRATLSPAFTGSKMKIMFTLIIDYAKQFVNYLEQHSAEFKSVDFTDLFTRFSNDVIAITAFGYNCDSMKDRDNKFYLMGKDITTFQGFWKNLKLLFCVSFPKLAEKLGLALFSKQTTNYFISLIKENMAIREKNGIVRPDMLQLLMEARKEKKEHPGQEQLTDVDITAQALIFFFAGFDTVSSSMSFMAYELAVNVEIQERLQAEIDSTIEECNGEVTYDALVKMKYMDMVIAESMRKWPAAIITDRVCTKPYTIQPIKEGEVSLTLHPGQILWIPTFGIQRDPDIYCNPDRFDPERFNNDSKTSISPYQFFPFGVGPRMCIGNRFALMEMKLLFCYMLHKFNIVVTEKTTIPVEIGKSQFQLFAKGGMWLGLKRRSEM